VNGCSSRDKVVSDTNDQFEDAGVNEISAPPDVSRRLFMQWRTPRLGRSNPERMTNPVWNWLVKTMIGPYQATQLMNGPSALEAGPGWCFNRNGQSTTKIPDGRVVFIGGEHEDSYDPDFYIYNDVVLQHPDGKIEIFGYPREVFPPTDFHSATLVGNQIVIIGSLGYPEDRRPGKTQVLVLNLENLSISVKPTTGSMPGWIHKHTASLSSDCQSIQIQQGLIDRDPKDSPLVENLDEWRLHLGDWRWERLTERSWPRWEVRRKDGRWNDLFNFQIAAWDKQTPGLKEERNRILREFELPTLEEKLGEPPNLELFASLYQPPVAFDLLPKSEGENEHNIRRIKVAGVVVRYVESMIGIQMTVEGDLPQATLDMLVRDLHDKFSRLENTPCELIQL
jgi:hypothetical protein